MALSSVLLDFAEIAVIAACFLSWCWFAGQILHEGSFGTVLTGLWAILRGVPQSVGAILPRSYTALSAMVFGSRHRWWAAQL